MVASPLQEHYYSYAISALISAIEAREYGLSAAPLVIALHSLCISQDSRTAPLPSYDAVVQCVTKFSVIAADVWLRGGRGVQSPERETLSDAAFFVADLMYAVDSGDSAHAVQSYFHALRVLAAEFLHPGTTAERCEHTASLMMSLPSDDRLRRFFHGDGLLPGIVSRVIGYLGKAPHTPVSRSWNVMWLLNDALGTRPWSRVRSVSSDDLVLALARFVSLNYERCTSKMDWIALAHAATAIAPAYVRLTDRRPPSVYVHTLFSFLLGVAPALSADAAGDGAARECTSALCSAVHCCIGSLEPLFENPELELMPAEVEFLRQCCDATATAHPCWESRLTQSPGELGVAYDAANLLFHHALASPSTAAVSLAPVLLWVLSQTHTGQQVIRDGCALNLATMVQALTAGGAPQLTRLKGCSSAAHICSNALRITTGCVDASLCDLQGLSAARFEAMPDTCEAAWLDSPDLRALLQRLRCCEAWLGTLVNAAAGDAEWMDCLVPDVMARLVTTVLDQFYPAALTYTTLQRRALPGGATGPERVVHVDNQLSSLTSSVEACCLAAAFAVYNLAKTCAGRRAYLDVLHTPALRRSLSTWAEVGCDGLVGMQQLPESHWQRTISEDHPACFRASAALRRLKEAERAAEREAADERFTAVRAAVVKRLSE